MLYDLMNKKIFTKKGADNPTFFRNIDSILSSLLDHLSNKNIQMIMLILIKGLYDVLAIKYLKTAWYRSIFSGYNVNFDIGRAVIGYPVFIIVSVIVININFKNKFLDTIKHLLFILYFLPINSSFYLQNPAVSFFVLSHLYFILLIFLLVIVERISNTIEHKTKFGNVDRGDKKREQDFVLRFLVIVSGIVCIALIAHKISYNGSDISFDISEDSVYGSRQEYLDNMRQYNETLFSYALSLIRSLSSIASIFLIYYALEKRKIISGTIGALCIVANFSLDSSKGTLFIVAVVFVVFVLYRLSLLKNFNSLFTLGILIALILSFFMSNFYMVIVRRLMFIPAWMNNLYHDFFSSHPLVLWSQDAVPFKWLFTSQYSVSPLELISDTYFLGEMPSPNTGLFAEAFMHFGPAGTIIYPVILSLLVVWFAKGIDILGEGLSVLLAVRIAITMINVPVTRIDFILGNTLFVFIIYLIKILWKIKNRSIIVSR